MEGWLWAVVEGRLWQLRRARACHHCARARCCKPIAQRCQAVRAAVDHETLLCRPERAIVAATHVRLRSILTGTFFLQSRELALCLKLKELDHPNIHQMRYCVVAAKHRVARRLWRDRCIPLANNGCDSLVWSRRSYYYTRDGTDIYLHLVLGYSPCDLSQATLPHLHRDWTRARCGPSWVVQSGLVQEPGGRFLGCHARRLRASLPDPVHATWHGARCPRRRRRRPDCHCARCSSAGTLCSLSRTTMRKNAGFRLTRSSCTGRCMHTGPAQRQL